MSIFIKTTRYSKLFEEIFNGYLPGGSVEIESQSFSQKDESQLKQWCINSNIIATKDFSLKRNGVELFYFHDHPENLSVADSEKEFVERLKKEGLIRVIYPKIKSPEKRRNKLIYAILHESSRSVCPLNTFKYLKSCMHLIHAIYYPNLISMQLK